MEHAAGHQLQKWVNAYYFKRNHVLLKELPGDFSIGFVNNHSFH